MDVFLLKYSVEFDFFLNKIVHKEDNNKVIFNIKLLNPTNSEQNHVYTTKPSPFRQFSFEFLKQTLT